MFPFFHTSLSNTLNIKYSFLSKLVKITQKEFGNKSTIILSLNCFQSVCTSQHYLRRSCHSTEILSDQPISQHLSGKHDQTVPQEYYQFSSLQIAGQHQQQQLSKYVAITIFHSLSGCCVSQLTRISRKANSDRDKKTSRQILSDYLMFAGQHWQEKHLALLWLQLQKNRQKFCQVKASCQISQLAFTSRCDIFPTESVYRMTKRILLQQITLYLLVSISKRGYNEKENPQIFCQVSLF